MKVRYADRINYLQEVDENILDIPVPCMVLQPIIENAFIHGISELESGGTITLRVRDDDDKYTIEVEDNGVGMTSEKINQILGDNTEEDRPTGYVGHTTGIGTRNVMLRLKNFFDYEHVLDIVSSRPGGTRVIISIPKICVRRKKEYLHA